MGKESIKTLWTRTGVFIAAAALILVPLLRAGAMEPQISAGYEHTVGLKSNGTVVAVGAVGGGFGETNVGSWTDIIAVSAAYSHTLGLKSDGTVVAAGDNTFHQADVNSWIGIKAVSAGYMHSVGLKNDGTGTVVAVGDNGSGQTLVDAWTNIKAVSAGHFNTVALKYDGTVVGTGDNNFGQLNFDSWTQIVAVVAATFHTVGLKSDGTVVAVGGVGFDHGQLNVGSWTNIVAIAAGDTFTVGLKSDGTVVAVGNSDGFDSGQMNVGSWTNIIAISASATETVGLRSDGTVLAAGGGGGLDYGQLNVASWFLDADPKLKGNAGAQIVLEGSGFGALRGTVFVGTVPTKIVTWYDSMIVVQLLGNLLSGEYPIYITPRGAASPLVYEKHFFMMGPKIQFIKSNVAAPGETVVITGKHFGSKKGTLLIGANSCPAAYWFMDATSGKSMAVFKVPTRITPGTYNVTVSNGTEWDDFPTAALTVKPRARTGTDHGSSYQESFPEEWE